jgi:trans-AT polyketide synthase/acyltransferase/oxidoreductase domain-containing protein
MKAFLFPGQGAQRVGMGEGLFEEFADLTHAADAVLGYSIRDLCLNGPMERLTLTQFTQPAVYVVNALTYLKRVAAEPRPDYVLGHSVSEIAALFAAGSVDFETGLRLVQKRGELMGQATGGGMAAVLGLDADQVAALLDRHQLTTVFAVNFNAPRQIVVSGKKADVERAEPLFLAGGATYYKALPVGGAFHTPFMADAQDAFREFVKGIQFQTPAIPVISNVTARPHDSRRIRETLAQQITAPVQWCESIRYLLAKGLSVKDFEEIGPAGAGIVKPMVVRTQAEAGPLDAAALKQEEREQREKSASLPLPIGGNCRCGTGFGAASLGSRAFCDDFGLKYPYLSGGMYQGIASVDVVVTMAKAGLMGFFGVGGLKMPEVKAAIVAIQDRIPPGAPYGINFISHSNYPEIEEQLTDLLLERSVRTIEASAFMEVTPALVRYRARGLARTGDGRVRPHNRIIAKISRPEVAEQFLSPAPARLVSKLLAAGAISREEAGLLPDVPIADALCVESDSGGHTDRGMPFTLVPAIQRLREKYSQRYAGFGPIYVGAAGGIGTPEAAAAVFVMGADFILTGSVNQCTVEAGTSDVVKDLLQEMNVHDTDYAPSGELFELGSTVQVFRKGVFFASRANKLVALYHQHDSIDAIGGKTRQQIQDSYFKRSFEEVYAEVCAAYPAAEIERSRRDPKHRMALIFKRYFKDSTRWALAGDLAHKVDFQIQCGSALGAFNQWIAGTELASWRNRHVDGIAERLMTETASLLNRRFIAMRGPAR